MLFRSLSIAPFAQRYASYWSLSGWLLHGCALGLSLFDHGGLRVGFALMLSAALWLTVAAYWIENLNLSVDGLRRLVLPSAAIAIALPLIFPGSEIPLAGKSPLFSWHIALSTLAYGSLTVAAFHAVLMVMQESRLQDRKSTRLNSSH